MATRATYLISTAGPPVQTVCFYIHFDGCPAAAAGYFRKMNAYKNPRGGYAGRFVRANPTAEFTGGHEAHSDTEYAYTLNEAGQLTVCHRAPGAEWHEIYQGAWYEFVNQQLQPHDDPGMTLYAMGSPFAYQSNDPRPYWYDTVMTLPEAENYVATQLEKHIATLRKMHKEGRPFNTLSNTYLNDATDIQHQIGSLKQTGPSAHTAHTSINP